YKNSGRTKRGAIWSQRTTNRPTLWITSLDYFFPRCLRRAAQRAFIISDNRFLPAGVIPPFLGRPGPLAASPETGGRPRRRTPAEPDLPANRSRTCVRRAMCASSSATMRSIDTDLSQLFSTTWAIILTDLIHKIFRDWYLQREGGQQLERS